MVQLYRIGVTELFDARWPDNYGRVMDLSAWLVDGHDDLRTRLFGAVVNQVPALRWHEQVDGGGSSITWLLFHLARHQDLALNTAIRNRVPLFATHQLALGLAGAAPGAGLSEREQPEVSAAIQPEPLTDYVEAVFGSTRRWMLRVSAMALESIPDVARRLDRLASLDRSEFAWLYEMWAGHNVRWFVQWPVLGHGHGHLGEAIAVRNRMGLSPF